MKDDGRRPSSASGCSNDPVSAIYSSPLSRTIETAHDHRHDVRPAPIQPRDGLREISHGRWEGLTRAEVEARFGDEYAAVGRRSVHVRAGGRRIRRRGLARALPVIREIVTHHQGERVIVVSHKATIRILLSSLLGFDAARLSRSPRSGAGVPQRRSTFAIRCARG